MTTLFDPIVRTRVGPKRRAEPTFAYVNESARPELVPIRDHLEESLRRFPATHAPELVHRFRSDDGLVHLSALFELFVHQQLVEGGYEVICHPPISGTEKTPDFLATADGLPALYVECVLAAQDKKKTGRERVLDEALDAIDELRSTDFLLEVEVHGHPSGSLPVGRTQLVQKLETWLGGLDADAITREYLSNGRAALPAWTWAGADVRLEFTATPKKPEARERGQRLVGLQTVGISSLMRVDAMIEGAVRKKAARYGELSLPYLIAINVQEFPVDGDDIDQALHQSWGTTAAPKNRRVSGLLLATVWNVRCATLRQLQLILNPSAARPLARGSLPFHDYDGATLDA